LRLIALPGHRETKPFILTVEQLHWLLDGIDLAVIRKHPLHKSSRAAFSASSSFIGLISAASMPPYYERHL
jgi:hypothetical protein